MTPHSQRLDYVPALTGLRGVAAGVVLVFHLWQFSGGPSASLLGYPIHAFAACGFLGVDLFFVLSAFLLSQPFLVAAQGARAWPALPTYFLRRVRRVLPAFWVQIALLFVVGWIVAGKPPYDARTLLATAFFAQHLFAGVANVNPVYWSLPVEWWFYFCIPAVAWLFGRARWWLLLPLFLLLAFTFRLLCWHWLYDGQWDSWNNYGSIMHLRARIDQFFLGVLAAWAHLRIARESRWRAIAAGVGVIALLALLPSIAARGDLFVKADYPWVLVHYAAVAAPLAMIVFGAAGAGRWARVLLANPVIAWLGAISYSLYLWHYPVLEWSRSLGLWQRLPAPLAAASAAAAALTLAWLSYRLVERRFVQD